MSCVIFGSFLSTQWLIARAKISSWMLSYKKFAQPGTGNPGINLFSFIYHFFIIGFFIYFSFFFHDDC